MTEKDLSAMTVMQLRKLAKEQQITLGSGVDKAGIIRKILESGSDAPAFRHTIPPRKNQPFPNPVSRLPGTIRNRRGSTHVPPIRLPAQPPDRHGRTQRLPDIR